MMVMDLEAAATRHKAKLAKGAAKDKKRKAAEARAEDRAALERQEVRERVMASRAELVASNGYARQFSRKAERRLCRHCNLRRGYWIVPERCWVLVRCACADCAVKSKAAAPLRVAGCVKCARRDVVKFAVMCDTCEGRMGRIGERIALSKFSTRHVYTLMAQLDVLDPAQLEAFADVTARPTGAEGDAA